MARIDYCNCLLYSVPAAQLSKLQRFQYSEALLITYTPRFCRKSLELHALHWLPVKFRICYKIAVISFKAIHNLGPDYLSDLINIRRCFRYNPRCYVGVFFFARHSATFKRILGDRSFTTAAPKIWNVLPNYIRKENYFDKFKKLLNTYYFRESYIDFV